MVRPVDLQDNLSKAPIASSLQHVQQTSPAAAQRQAAQHLAQEHTLDHSRTRPAEPRDEVELHLDGREESGRRREKRKKKRRGEQETAAGPQAPAHIDITA